MTAHPVEPVAEPRSNVIVLPTSAQRLNTYTKAIEDLADKGELPTVGCALHLAWVLLHCAQTSLAADPGTEGFEQVDVQEARNALNKAMQTPDSRVWHTPFATRL